MQLHNSLYFCDVYILNYKFENVCRCEIFMSFIITEKRRKVLAATILDLLFYILCSALKFMGSEQYNFLFVLFFYTSVMDSE